MKHGILGDGQLTVTEHHGHYRLRFPRSDVIVAVDFVLHCTASSACRRAVLLSPPAAAAAPNYNLIPRSCASSESMHQVKLFEPGNACLHACLPAVKIDLRVVVEWSVHATQLFARQLVGVVCGTHRTIDRREVCLELDLGSKSFGRHVGIRAAAIADNRPLPQ